MIELFAENYAAQAIVSHQIAAACGTGADAFSAALA
jgi:hypothetical protein